jgi:hypothetical protein
LHLGPHHQVLLPDGSLFAQGGLEGGFLRLDEGGGALVGGLPLSLGSGQSLLG